MTPESELAELTAILRVILVQKQSPQGHMVIGTGKTGTLEWAKANVQFRITRGDGSIEIRWDSSALKPEGV
jgi:hypothetical protein